MSAVHGNPGRRVLIGVGNRDRGDDAVGSVVCDLVREEQLPDVRIEVLEGSVLDVSTRWGPTDRVTIVDAAEPAGSPGRITTVDALTARLSAPGTLSTHSIDVGAAIELARVLDRLPAELRVIGVEGASFEHHAPLTREVQRSAGRVATRFSRREGVRAGAG
jgi:hydrogenase maturation protease